MSVVNEQKYNQQQYSFTSIKDDTTNGSLSTPSLLPPSRRHSELYWYYDIDHS